MPKFTFSKLVRDKIVDKQIESGAKPSYRILSHEEHIHELINKVIEINNNDLNNLLLKGILQGETLKTIKSGSFPVFWKFIAKNIERLNADEWKIIYAHESSAQPVKVESKK